MIDAALAERERHARELAHEYYRTRCFERDEPDLEALLLRWGAVCANEARLDEQRNHNMVTPKAWRERIAELERLKAEG